MQELVSCFSFLQDCLFEMQEAVVHAIVALRSSEESACMLTRVIHVNVNVWVPKAGNRGL